MHTSSIIVFVAAAGLLLFPFAVAAQEYGSQTSPSSGVPPVAQPLVREGDFAVKLAAAFGLGSPENETEAEDLLASAGVVPRNGWISDYPVTPEILGQLEEAAVSAATEGRLSLEPGEAKRRLYDLASQMNLPVPAGSGSAEVEPQMPEQPVIQNYYAGYGPPIITYYPPPPSYLYLYAWVPYPVWWYGYWYPGFYISHTFTTTIIVDSRPVFVRNRYVDPVTRRVVRIDPVVRSGDSVRPLTVLRTEDGRTFRNIRELRQGTPSGRVRDTGPGVTSRRPPGAGGFRSLEDRRNARDIYSRSIERQGSMGQGGRPAGSEMRRDERRRGRGPEGRATIQPQPRSDQRSYERRQRPGDPGRPQQPGRAGRSYEQESRDGRQFRGSAPGGRRHSVTPAPSVRPSVPQQRREQRSIIRPGKDPDLRPAAPSGGRSYAPQSRGDRGISNRPRPSGRWSSGDDGNWSGRGSRRWGR